MTTTINRPMWLAHRLWLGLAALLVAVAFALYQNTGNEPAYLALADVSTAGVAPDSGYWTRLQMSQDGYLPPAVASQPAIGRLVAHQLPLEYIQDGYLPTADVAALTQSDPNRMSDERLGGPR